MKIILMFPFTMQTGLGKIIQGSPFHCGCGQNVSENGVPNVEVDEEMKKRRELNAQMRIAVENEEFEKAAVLRDKIKELEAGRIKPCDTETSSRDLRNAQ